MNPILRDLIGNILPWLGLWVGYAAAQLSNRGRKKAACALMGGMLLFCVGYFAFGIACAFSR